MEAGSTQVLQQLASGSFAGLVSACEELELAMQDELPETPSPEQIAHMDLLYAAHLLAYLLEGRLSAARFLWKRTPASLQSQPQLAAAHSTFVASWRRQFPEFFSLLQTSTWDARLQPLAAQVITSSREQLLDQISEAYKVITLDSTGRMLGLDSVSARAACEQRGWAVDAADNVLPVPKKTMGDDLMSMGSEQLGKLAEYVAYLEQPQCRI
mmetsp:Transcript_61994/g.108564  ORF Transcript_61994/g.108564 Transcript_61994/m.108564 type:complete len:212 (-) Transcript_61994:16-651(-)